jgi:hypothetical protein
VTVHQGTLGRLDRAEQVHAEFLTGRRAVAAVVHVGRAVAAVVHFRRPVIRDRPSSRTDWLGTRRPITDKSPISAETAAPT